MKKSEKKAVDFVKLIASLLMCYAAAFIGSFFTFQSIPTWYASIQKPWFNPPNWVFGPVWTLLYTLMGVSLYLVWMKHKDKKALYLFGVQLVLNIVWSLIFFGLHNIGLAFIEIVFLWMAIAVTIGSFMKISKTAGLLLIPYLLWVSFAAVLNLYIWQLNP